jgi:hypothetical protein
MKFNLGKQEAFLVAITIIFFAAFYALDTWLNRLRLEGMSSLNPTPYIWWSSFANVFLAGSLLFLAWYTLQKRRTHFLVALLFIVAGAITAFYPVLALLYGISFLPSSPLFSLGPASLFLTGGGFLLVLGLLMLLPNRRR